MLNPQTAAERAKYNAWRSKSGIASLEAMRLYVTESERQVRVYGSTASSSSMMMTPENTPRLMENGSSSPSVQPRGLAAIPLLCAAASESRQAYLRRLAQTDVSQGWWRRQEPLCATPGTVLAVPEFLVIQLAALLESLSLTDLVPAAIPLPVVQSFLWPLHNSLLALWMGVILVYTAWTACWELFQTVLWGSRRTGLSLTGIWKDQVLLTSQSIKGLTESHQPLSARLVGLVLSPLTFLVWMTTHFPILWTCILYTAAMVMTWWYWTLTLPFLAICLLGTAVALGNCFALIELAGV